MIFVDGENLAIRYAEMMRTSGAEKRPDISFERNVFVWSPAILHEIPSGGTPAIMRKYYYTAVQGDAPKVEDIEIRLKEIGMETPRVFKKEKGKGSKRVDITLTTDMLLHATRKHYDVAVLVAGDEDYVPLVRAVQGEGARVYTWFLSSGMSPALKKASDHHVNLDPFLLAI